MSEIDRISNHVIVCGFGRNGQQAAHTLTQHKEDFVVIDKEDTHFAEWQQTHPSLIYIHGDATDDDILTKAGVRKAKALLLTVPADADNVFIVLSAKSVNPRLQIISRAGQKSAVSKLKTAGADHVILPDTIGGAHMAALISKPDAIEFINYLWGNLSDSINIESVGYEKLPDILKDKSIFEIVQWLQTGINCIGIRDEKGTFLINPSSQTLISNGMKIILLGTQQQIEKLRFDLRI